MPAVRALAPIDDGPSANVPTWPLARPIADILEARETIGRKNAGKVIDAMDDVKALRALRARAEARGIAIYVFEGAQRYHLQIRDELPTKTDTAVRAFMAMSNRWL